MSRRRAALLALALAMASCPGDTPPGDPGAPDAPAVDAAFADAAGTPDALAPDAALPRPVTPCAQGDCWETTLAAPPCSTSAREEDFSSGLYNVHAYATVAWDGVPLTVSVERLAGDWAPALVVSDGDGRTLFDGEVGVREPGLEVTSTTTTDQASVRVSSARTLPLGVHVTSTEALASDFSGRIPTAARYRLTLASECGGSSDPCVVNGHTVPERACGWIRFVALRVVPRLEGTRDERLTAAARVTWWSLKEGVLYVPNPLAYSNCGVGGHIGPLAVCPSGHAWQVGLSGVQVPGSDVAALEATAERLFPGSDVAEVLATAAAEAGLDAADAAAVVASTDALRRSWLLRVSAVGFTHQAGTVTDECVEGSIYWCYGTGWDATADYAPDREAALRAIDDVRRILAALAP